MAFALSSSSSLVARVQFKQRATRTFRASNGNVMKTVASAKPMWLPGAKSPEYLDGSLPGDYGFDPLGLGKDPASLARVREAELIHSRWCMLAVTGMISVEALGFGDWISAPLQETQTYFGQEVPIPSGALIAIEFLAMAFLEAKRNDETDPEKRCYPGGPFDPLGYSKNPESFEMMKKKEIANGRLAMLATLGFFIQGATTGTTPLANLAEHIADPWTVSVARNATALPW
eukprot:CAMPEP_0197847360 /NCGR_PEP_ID=MMETSP1438-20131217/5799_1 /TAXON_ID=1461541 /ORGANISM="Pterosperma sp., Strain CCMP1384" /LENGTH=230 /DNA_ID=CAMNT_0043459253 /DNA_START=73 /DNA_END=765 /DNA_ORIENTATION=+